MRTDKMRSTHERPGGIGDACAIYQQRAARVIVGKICLLGDVGRRISARPGVIPFVPSMRSHPKVVYLLYRQFPLDILRQGVGLCNIRKDIIPATITTAQFTGWNDAIFATQPIQSACNRFIHCHVRVPDEVLLRRNCDIGSEFLRAHTEIAILSQVYHYPFIIQELQVCTRQQVRSL